MKKLAIVLAASLWALVIMQACQVEYRDEQQAGAYTSRLRLEQELKLDAERMMGTDSVAANIILDTLAGIQQADRKEVVLPDINIAR